MTKTLSKRYVCGINLNPLTKNRHLSCLLSESQQKYSIFCGIIYWEICLLSTFVSFTQVANQDRQPMVRIFETVLERVSFTERKITEESDTGKVQIYPWISYLGSWMNRHFSKWHLIFDNDSHYFFCAFAHDFSYLFYCIKSIHSNKRKLNHYGQALN